MDRDERISLCTLGLLIVLAGGAAVASPIITGTDAGPPAHVKAFNGVTLAEEASFFAYGPAFTGGVRVALGDVTGDGLGDIVTGAGPGAGSHVKVFNGLTTSEVRSFFAYGGGFTGGVYVAAGDVTGDGRADIVTGAGSSSTHVKVFDSNTLTEVRSFLAFGAAALGVRVAAGDVNGDGRADIVAGTSPGATHVKVFDGVSGTETVSFLPYGGFTGGVFVAAGDVTGDGKAELITGPDEGGGGLVRVFDSTSLLEIQSFIPFAGFNGGVRVGAGDINGDGRADILAATGPGGGAVRAYDGVTFLPIHNFTPYTGFTGGIFVAGETPIPEPGSALVLILAGIGSVSLRRRATGRISL